MAGNFNDGHFMAEAVKISQQSAHPKWKVGAVIVRDKKIVGRGYNNGCNGEPDPQHAEINAINNANQSNLKDCTMYVTMFPCKNCEKHIRNKKMKIVKYTEKYDKKHEIHSCWY